MKHTKGCHKTNFKRLILLVLFFFFLLLISLVVRVAEWFRWFILGNKLLITYNFTLLQLVQFTLFLLGNLKFNPLGKQKLCKLNWKQYSCSRKDIMTPFKTSCGLNEISMIFFCQKTVFNHVLPLWFKGWYCNSTSSPLLQGAFRL